jgi:hypothetical protein
MDIKKTKTLGAFNEKWLSISRSVKDEIREKLNCFYAAEGKSFRRNSGLRGQTVIPDTERAIVEPS